MLIDEIKNIKSDKKELRKFGYSIGIVALLMAAVLIYFDKMNSVYVFGGIGAFLVVSALIMPIFLLPVQKVWMTFAVVMGFISSRVILIILYYLVITPIGFFARLFRKDFLNTKLDRSAESYWEIRPKIEYNKEQTDRQF